MDTKPPFSVSDDGSAGLTTSLLDVLTLYSQRRDAALGLPRPSRRTLNLLAYRHKQQRTAVVQVAQAAFLRGIVETYRDEVKRLIEGADTAEKRREILSWVQQLNEWAEIAGNVLGEITVTEADKRIDSKTGA